MDLLPLEQVSKTLRKKRREIGTTQKKVADIAGLSTSQVNRIEKNSVNPSYKSIHSFYEALKTLEEQDSETAEELMHEEITYVSEEETLEQAARKMRKNDFSQLPVKGERDNIGRITERKLLKAENPDKAVKKVMEPELLTVTPETQKKALKEILKQEPAVLVKKEAELKGIVTKADML